VTVVVNGEPRPVDAGTTLGALLVSLGVQPATVVVERNGQIVARDAFGRTVLAEGDRLEVVRFVGGG